MVAVIFDLQDLFLILLYSRTKSRGICQYSN
jgi:hypothetical protein